MKYRILSFVICISAFLQSKATSASDTLWTKGTLTSNFSFIEREIKLDSLERRYQKHGYLRDNCIEFTDLDCYNKKIICDSNCVTRDIFPDLLRSAITMNSTGCNWNVEDVLSCQSKTNALNNCPIAIVQYMYIQLKESALKEGLVKLDGDYVKDVYKDGIHQDPYIDGVLFAFSPSDTLFYNHLTFSFPNDIYKSNVSPQIEFDADDGKGFQPISRNGTLSVNYQPGRHHLKMRMSLGSDTFYAHCFINTINEFTQTRNLDENRPDTIIIGSMKAYLAKKIRFNNKPTRPFLFVEGFDPDFTGNAPKDKSIKYGSMGYSNILNKVEYKDLTNNFDVYYLDFKDCTLSIKKNALLFEEAIKRINEVRDTTAYPITVMGSSMGGLIARYGLRMMEMQGKRHHVSTLICQDTPNLGANVPLGILYASHALLKIYNRYISKYYNINDKLSLLRKYVYCQSAREMLYNFVNEEGNIDNSVHEAFIRELHDMGYPCGDDGTLRCIAISNGNEQIVSTDDTLLKFYAEMNPSILTDALLSLLSNITGPLLGFLAKDAEVGLLAGIPGTQKFRCTAEINPTGAGKNICDVRLTYKKKILGLVHAQKTFFKYIKSDIAQGISYDIANGSYYDKDLLMENLNLSLPNGTVLDNILAKIDAKMEIKKTFLFVPTASALDIGEGVANLNMSDYRKTYDMIHRSERPKHSPFHAYYISNQSELHAHINTNILFWILSQLEIQIAGDPIGTTGSKYTISNLREGESVTWSSSSPTTAAIDATTGLLSCYAHGYTTIIGQLSNGMQYTKRIMSELPPYTIESLYTNSGYRVSLNINDNSFEYQRFHPFIKCERYIIQKGWVDFSDMYLWIPLNDNGGDVYVYCKLKYIDINNNTKEGSTVSSKINTSKPYILMPNYFEMLSSKEIKSVVLKPNPAYKGVLDDKLKIYHFESHGGVPPSCESGVTEMTLSANNVFSSSQIKAFTENTSQRTIANDFVIRNKKGEPILHFQIPIVKP